MDYLATLEACKRAIEREGLEYFKLQPKKLVSIHYNKEIVEGKTVAVTLHPLECMDLLTAAYLYSSRKGLQLFHKIGALQGLSTVEIPRNLMTPEIKPETLVLLIEQSFVPANDLHFDPSLCRDKNTLVDVVNKEWDSYGDSFEFYMKKLGIDLELLKSFQKTLIEQDLL